MKHIDTSTMEEGIEIPEWDTLESCSGQFGLRLPKSLHRELARRAKREGVSMNRYGIYRLSGGL